MLRGHLVAVLAAVSKRCARTLTAAILSRAGEPPGSDRVAFSGRIGGRALAPGAYRASLSAGNANGSSRAESLTFTVLR